MLLTCRLHIGDSQASLCSRGNQHTFHTVVHLVVCLGVEFEVGGLHLVVCLGVEFEVSQLRIVHCVLWPQRHPSDQAWNLLVCWAEHMYM